MKLTMSRDFAKHMDKISRLKFGLPLLAIVQLTACATYPFDTDSTDKGPYSPHPQVEVSIMPSEGHVAAYVRHSKGNLLFQLSPGNAGAKQLASVAHGESVIALFNPGSLEFSPNRYENFEESFDMFGDGTVVLVPLEENTNGATSVGVFVNLLSGKRYFLAPAVKSSRGRVKIRDVDTRAQAIVIVPEDKRTQERAPKFPEFIR